MYRRIRSILTPKVEFGLKVVTTTGLVALLVSKLDMDHLVSLPNSIDGGYLILGILFTTIFVALRVLKWRVLTSANGLTAPKADLIRSYLVSLAVGAVTPLRTGELARVVVFPRSSQTKATTLFLYDKLTDLWLILLCALVGSYQVNIVLFISFLACAFILGGILFFLQPILRILGKANLFTFAKKRLQSLLSSVEPINLSIPTYWLLTVLTYFFGYLAIIVLIRSFTPVVSWWFIILLPLVTLSNLLPITIGGIGIREGVAALVLPIADVPAEVAAASFFLAFALSILLPGVAGLCWNTVRTIRMWLVPTKDANGNSGATEENRQ
ncbi:lysylphosphatidylglycerol synthase transmembrane domain-containing protein [Chloroflexota bacterium]